MVTFSFANSIQAEDVAKVHHLFSAGGKTMALMSNVTTVSWMNCVLKLRD